MWYQIKPDKITLACKVKPNAKKTVILGVNGEYLHIALQAQPIEGVANEVLLKFLAKFFKIANREVILLRGQRSRIKIIGLPNQPQLKSLLATF